RDDMGDHWVGSLGRYMVGAPTDEHGCRNEKRGEIAKCKMQNAKCKLPEASYDSCCGCSSQHVDTPLIIYPRSHTPRGNAVPTLCVEAAMRSIAIWVPTQSVGTRNLIIYQTAAAPPVRHERP